MSSHEQIRLFFGLVMGLSCAIVVYIRKRSRQAGAAYAPLISPLNLLLMLFLFVNLGLLMGFEEEILGFFTQLVLQIGIYYAALLLFLPLLRKIIRPSTVAILWLLPNDLYITIYAYMRPNKPELILPVSARFIRWALPVWGLGFLGFMGWAVIRHLLYRKKLLRDAVPVDDPEILTVWEQEESALGFKNVQLPLVYSAATATPLSIGIWQTTTQVVLPERDYTPEELRLIFRHELIHIRHRDAATKLFLTFCQASCWFNPLMWIAMRKCADDLELSCDELALTDADSQARETYARLVLRTAGDERGFTTCLSVRAKSLRYRLRGIISERKKLAGGLLAGLLTSALILSSGYVAFAFTPSSGEDVIFQGHSATFEPAFIYSVPDPKWYPNQETFYRCTDSGALTAYLADLTLYRTTDFYDPDEANCLYLSLVRGSQTMSITLYDHLLTVQERNGSQAGRKEMFYFPEKLDRAYLDTLLELEPEE